jgi:hypothetical protein
MDGENIMSGFWRNWFNGFCLALLVFGIVLAGGAFAATTGPIRLLLVVLGQSDDIVFQPALRFSLGVLGAVTIGWAISFYTTIQAAIDLEQRGRPLWRGMVAAALGWFVIDNILSVATGFALNIIPNTLLLAQLLIGIRGSGVLKPPA